ncbi:MAG: hypothetical protein EZS28_033680 [Streblomastix strix]|uniref:Uncharacterized protein n=1 Tax=Streblomastix strix TaxID=222440 RepID=A0A5J4UKN4_9EUKA|nr:MAG: hypothetical protein EZS28_033680 [Streblomastix strix]
MSDIDLQQIEKEARQEFDAEKSQGAGGAGGMMEVDGMEDDYDYYESQAAKLDRLKQRAKLFERMEAHNLQRRRNVLATLVGYLNRDIKKINRLSSAVSAQKQIQDNHLDKRFRALEQDLDDNVATPDNVAVFDKKKNAFYSVDGYIIAVGFGDPDHQHKRNCKKKYYSDANDLECAALAAKLKASEIKGRPYMKWLSITKPHKEREIKLHNFRIFTVDAKKFINANGGAQLPMATKQQTMASIIQEIIAYSYCSTIYQ